MPRHFGKLRKSIQLINKLSVTLILIQFNLVGNELYHTYMGAYTHFDIIILCERPSFILYV